MSNGHLNSNKLYDSIRNSLTNLDNSMKTSGKKLKSLMEYTNINKFSNDKDDQNQTKMRNNKINNEIPAYNRMDSLASQLNNSQQQISELLNQYKDFQLSFQDFKKLDLFDCKELCQSYISDMNITSGTDSDIMQDSANNRQLDVFSVNPNAFSHFQVSKPNNFKKRNIRKNSINNYKQNWQLKILTKKVRNMKKDIEEMKYAMDKMSIFKEKIKKSMIELEKQISQVNQSGKEIDNSNKLCQNSSRKCFPGNSENLNETIELCCRKLGIEFQDVSCKSPENTTEIIRNKFDEIIKKNEIRSNFLICLLDLLQLIFTDQQRIDTIQRISEIIPICSDEKLSKYFQNCNFKSHFTFNDTIDLREEDNDGPSNDLYEILNSEEHFSNFSMNPIYIENLENIQEKVNHSNNKTSSSIAHSEVNKNSVCSNDYPLNSKIKQLINFIDEIFKVNLDKIFDYSMKEEIYQKVMTEFDRVINEELSGNKYIDSKMLYNEINNKNYSNFLKNYLSHGIWSCLTAYDNEIVKNIMENVYKNLSEFLLKHLKSIIAIAGRLNRKGENQKNNLLEPILQKINETKQDENREEGTTNCESLSEYIYDEYFVLNNSTCIEDNNLFNVENNSLNQLDAEEKDWIGQADKKESQINRAD